MKEAWWATGTFGKFRLAAGILAGGLLLIATANAVPVDVKGAYFIKGASGKCLALGASDGNSSAAELKPCDPAFALRFFIADGNYIFGDPHFYYLPGDPLESRTYLYLFHSVLAGGTYRISPRAYPNEMFRLVASTPASSSGYKQIKIAKFGSEIATCMTDRDGQVATSPCPQNAPSQIWTLVPTP